MIIDYAYDKLRNWVHENYHTAYVLGTGAIAAGIWALLPPKFRTLKLLGGGYAACLALGAALEPCVNFRSSLYGPVISHGSRSEPKFAFTFDDGPHPDNTPKILDILAKENIKASFFCVGENALLYPELIKRIKDEGHLLGSHSFSHKNLMACTPSESLEQIRRGIEAVSRVSGQPCRYIRPPYGMRYPWTLRQAYSLGQQVVLWSNWPRDWQLPGEDVIIERVVSEVQYGDIVLLHDGGGDRTQTVLALPVIIGKLRECGFSFVRVDEL